LFPEQQTVAAYCGYLTAEDSAAKIVQMLAAVQHKPAEDVVCGQYLVALLELHLKYGVVAAVVLDTHVVTVVVWLSAEPVVTMPQDL
jgi:hypothetical protein